MGGLTPPRPLAGDDDLAKFDCGRAALNAWLRRHAWRNQQSGASRTNIVCEAETGAIAGYVTLSMAQVERGHLPNAGRRNLPDPVAAVLLGQLAVDLNRQGQGVARSLLQFALRTALRLSEDVGCVYAITHPLDDTVRDFYRSFGFENLPFDPGGAMAVRLIDLIASSSTS